MYQNVLLLVVVICLSVSSCQPTDTTPTKPLATLVTSDIDNFWLAYDQVASLTDSLERLQAFTSTFIDAASPGQQQLFAVRNYTPQEYLDNFSRYPAFYSSLRRNFQQLDGIKADLHHSLQQFQHLYPSMRPAAVYMGMGNFRTNGTTVDTMVLFGCEMALTDTTINTSEFPEQLQYFKNYISENPIDNFDFLAIHEFVHTQQQEAIGTNLLTASLREGSAEFLAVLASGKPSTTPAVHYGSDNHTAIMEAFTQQMFNTLAGYWLWSSLDNPFDQRDLGYYLGYAMSKLYYEAHDKPSEAVADLIELDYSDTTVVHAFIDKLGFFSQPLSHYRSQYEQSRPTIKQVEQEEDHFTIHFSEPMDPIFRGFDYGPLGEKQVLRITEFNGFSPDSLSLSFRATLTPGQRQQMLLTSDFRSQSGVELTPYIIDISNE